MSCSKVVELEVVKFSVQQCTTLLFPAFYSVTNLVPTFVHTSPVPFCTHMLEFISDLVCLSACIFVFAQRMLSLLLF